MSVIDEAIALVARRRMGRVSKPIVNETMWLSATKSQIRRDLPDLPENLKTAEQIADFIEPPRPSEKPPKSLSFAERWGAEAFGGKNREPIADPLPEPYVKSMLAECREKLTVAKAIATERKQRC